MDLARLAFEADVSGVVLLEGDLQETNANGLPAALALEELSEPMRLVFEPDMSGVVLLEGDIQSGAGAVQLEGLM